MRSRVNSGRLETAEDESHETSESLGLCKSLGRRRRTGLSWTGERGARRSRLDSLARVSLGRRSHQAPDAPRPDPEEGNCLSRIFEPSREFIGSRRKKLKRIACA